jgi:DHA1 family bicyclomycin/chloramphenicol resistance-like MFS transporter
MTPPAKSLSQAEFIALIAMHFAIVAISIDAMLPALPEIARDLELINVNKAQLVLTSFLFGMGFGTLVVGPLSDSFGRKPVIGLGVVLFVIGAAIAALATSLEAMIVGRVLQGIGAAGPRIVSLAIVRDLYEGRRMAAIMSYAMVIFTLVPAVAPLMGATILIFANWRAIFLAFILFAIVLMIWLVLRQPETLAPDRRKPFRIMDLVRATVECFSHRVFFLSTMVQCLAYGVLFSTLSTVQPIFEIVYDRNDSFPLWFALIAVLGGCASVLNARIVERVGMRNIAFIGLTGQAIISAIVILALSLTGHLPFGIFIFWTTTIFFMIGLVLGNLNALAMEPVGHIAGLAASVIGSVSTVLGVFLAIPIGLAFNGTPLPLAVGLFALTGLGALIIRLAMR